MKKLFLLLLISVLPEALQAQYTEIINSNLPGTSQSAYAVGGRVLQFEGGVWFEKNQHKYTDTRMDFTGVNYAVRYGFWREQFEMMLNGTLAYDYTTAPAGNSSHFGFVNNTVGAKYLIFKPEFLDEEKSIYSWRANNSFRWKNLTPSVAGYLGLNFLPNKRYFYETIPVLSPKAAVILQAEPIPRVVFVLNGIADRFLEKHPEYSFIATVTHNLRDGRFSIFVEQQGVSSYYYKDAITRMGGAMLLGDLENAIQLNAEMGFGWKDTPSRYMGLIGASYRIDNHNSFIKKKLKEQVEPTKIKGAKKPKKRKKNDLD
ncbi:Putative MetA-pathway of phenol degradation [Capnocytophaga haemolytica]|jgi:hypothetical protein|uniref:Phenol degradation protein meta n=1 Tax=Capnocytophaga haemolytica TaxID=45243 RepID=A0AAX2GYY8_9FLAO|nr:transporter [Capnocytophaga haemolytica]AMD84188.1 phenol degradation protein meta [Capnocytophaga haemolytica]SFN93819.1 Putative MetA-pathway of phenol degradation [Capnocytophaga haemolytica]SNV12805.1 Uncharacterised protein [Capnocytophaga haemolytica]